MGQINLLDSSVYNQIAAGEVVENPSSVVKELVENSIDAGATQITVMIESGGIKSISVIDNGCGMDASDMSKAILPHATSKITDASDLFSIGTLGFRGEALASICSVAQVEMTSRFLEAENGYRILVKGGEIIEEGTHAIREGTSITITHFFYNTPVRFKFLKSAKGEEAGVERTIAELIFSNPYIAIEYISDGKTIYQSLGRGLDEALFAVYNNQIALNMIPMQLVDDGYSVQGYVGRPRTFAIRGNRNNQTFIINGRVIRSDEISAVLRNAYGEYLMKRTFPTVILDIIIPFEEVDVNVHPRKREVRFSNEKKLFGIIFHACKNALSGDSLTQKIVLEQELKPQKQTKNVSTEENDEILKPLEVFNRFREHLEERKSEKYRFAEDDAKEHMIDNVPLEDATQNEVNSAATVLSQAEVETIEENTAAPIGAEAAEKTKESHRDTENSILPPERQQSISVDELLSTTDESDLEKEPTSRLVFADSADYVGNLAKNETAQNSYKIIGQMFETYILLEVNDKLYMLDQHAVHERILYDKMKVEMEKSLMVQQLLYPFDVSLSLAEKVVLEEKLPQLENLGFRVEFKDDRLLIHAIPYILYQSEIDNFITGLLENQNELEMGEMEYIKDKLAKAACRKAIKAGEQLGMTEIRYVMEYFLKHDIPLECPHGRPTIVTISKTEIEKLFKRII